jgi:hypothetical protein
VEFLVHGHRFFDFVVLDEDSFCLVELFVENSELGLHSKVVVSLRGNKFI